LYLLPRQDAGPKSDRLLGLLDPEAGSSPGAGVLEVTATGRLVTAEGVFIGAGGSFQGSTGSVVGPQFRVMEGGALRPGLSPGSLTIEGDLILDPGAILEIEIAGYGAGTGYDRITVTGDTVLGGTLVLSFLDGFLPQPGDLFDFLAPVGTLLGAFDTVSVLGAPGLTLDPTALARGRLEITGVPVPQTLPLLALGALGLAGWRRRP
jgi:hypothetical protein